MILRLLVSKSTYLLPRSAGTNNLAVAKFSDLDRLLTATRLG